VVRMDCSGLGQVSVKGICEHGNNISGFVKCCECFELPSNWKVLRKALVSWSKLERRTKGESKRDC
jgi:hypothetical protein